MAYSKEKHISLCGDDPREPYRIGLVAPYGNLTSIFKRVSSTLPVRLNIRMGVALEEAVSAAEELFATTPKENQPDVLCSRGGTADYLRLRLGVPVVSIDTTALDLLRTLLPFAGKIRRVAFFHYQCPMPEVQTVATALGMEIREYFFTTRTEHEARMLEATVAGAELAVGGILVSEMRSRHNVDSIVLEAGEDAISRSLEAAMTLVQVRREELQRHARSMTILNTITEGIMVTDGENRLEVINPMAASLLRLNPEKVIGRDSRDVVPNTRTWEVLQSGQPELNEVQDIGGLNIVTSRVPIRVNGHTVGVVCTFAAEDRIRQAEQQLRKRGGKGFCARYALDDILTENQSLRLLKQLAAEYAGTDASVLIQGESGTGKELFAQGIHNASGRGNGPFVAINCAAIAPSLLESELFGYAEGAFTSAQRKGKPGVFELAHRGTLFLDEISEIPFSLQAKLLRVLQEREVVRVGGISVIPVDVRVVCATNKPLLQHVRSGQFRADLYYRCNVLPLSVPPLRERGRDVYLLFCAMLRKHGGRFGDLAPKDLQQMDGGLLASYPWPGNVRELINIVNRFMLAAGLFPDRTGEQLIQDVFVREEWADMAWEERRHGHGLLKDRVRMFEADTIRHEMALCDNDPARVINRLGISKASLWRKLRCRDATLPEQGE